MGLPFRFATPKTTCRSLVCAMSQLAISSMRTYCSQNPAHARLTPIGGKARHGRTRWRLPFRQPPDQYEDQLALKVMECPFFKTKGALSEINFAPFMNVKFALILNVDEALLSEFSISVRDEAPPSTVMF